MKFFKLGFLFFLILFFSTNLSANLPQDILKKVKKLKIGIENYCIGYNFIDSTKKKTIKGAYPGTKKYKVKDLYITVDANSNIVIGLYKIYKNKTIDSLKKVISFLMLKFGEPTLEAHDKNIYWFFDENGKISQEKFLNLKKNSKLKPPLVMVKFNSDIPLSKLTKNKNKKTNFYFIIYSEPLIKNFKK